LPNGQRPLSPPQWFKGHLNDPDPPTLIRANGPAAASSDAWWGPQQRLSPNPLIVRLCLPFHAPWVFCCRVLVRLARAAWPALLTQPVHARPCWPTGAPAPLLRRPAVRPLPGRLRQVWLSRQHPELIVEPGSCSPLRCRAAGAWLASPSRSLRHLENTPIEGHFEAVQPPRLTPVNRNTLDSTLWLGGWRPPRGRKPVRLRLISGSTACPVDRSATAAPFLRLPALSPMTANLRLLGAGKAGWPAEPAFQKSRRSPCWPTEWQPAAGQLTTLVALPIPVKGPRSPLERPQPPACG